MNGALPPPLVPRIVDLRDFPYMPLDVVRLRDSSLSSRATGEEFRCAVLLWCVAWHQVPAASLPDDDVDLAHLAGFGRSVSDWRQVREGALRGWVRCSDGRLYHPTVAEKALEAWESRLRQRWQTECGRLKKQAQRAQAEYIAPEFDEWRLHFERTGSAQLPVSRDIFDASQGTKAACPPEVPRETPSKGREGKGREGNSSTGETSAHPAPLASPAAGDVPEAVPGTVTAATRAAIALRKLDLRITGQNPDLIAACDEGVTVEALLETAAAYPGKPAAYVIATARRVHAEAAAPIAVGAPRAATPSRQATAIAGLVRAATPQESIHEPARLVHDADR